MSGAAGAVTSGTVTTTVAGDIIYGWSAADWSCTVGSGFSARSAFNNNLVEDLTSGNAGPYAAQETQARSHRRGLFADARPEPPRDFRKRHGSCH